MRLGSEGESKTREHELFLSLSLSKRNLEEHEDSQGKDKEILTMRRMRYNPRF